MRLSAKLSDGGSRIDGLRTSGATKLAFPRGRDALEAIMLNTAGGLTGGDRFETVARAGPGSRLVLTTQAAERAYRSAGGAARVSTCLAAAEGAALHWLPQELILFDGCSLDRRLELDIAGGAEAVLVEPVVFGRRAMGEKSISGTFRDRVTLRRDGEVILRDRVDFAGSISARLARPAVADGMTALAAVYAFGARAGASLHAVRRMLPRTGGASLVAPDLLVIRLLAPDSFLLRRSLVPILECLTADALPKSWRL